MKLSVLKYVDDLDKDFREQIRATGQNLHKRFGEILYEIVEKENITIENFAKKLGYSDKQTRVWREGKAAIPLSVLVEIWKLGKKDSEELETLVEYLKVYRSNKVVIPKILTPELAEIAGRHCGDGSCTISTNKDYRVTLTETSSLIRVHNNQIRRIFGLKPTVERITNDIQKSIVNSKVYCRFFTKILEIPSGNKTFIAQEPGIIRSAGINFRKFFVRGLIDTEGSLYFDKANRTWVLEINMVNKNLISTIAEVFEKSNLKHKLMQKKKSYSLRLVGKDKIKRYFMTFGTSNGKYKLEF